MTSRSAMLRCLALFLASLLPFSRSLHGEDNYKSEFEDVLSLYRLLKMEAEDSLEVCVQVTIVVDRETPKLVRGEERSYRQVFSDSRFVRTDGLATTEIDMSGKTIRVKLEEHFLVTSDSMFVWRSEGLGLEKLERKAGRLPSQVFTGVLSPYDLAFGSVHAFDQSTSFLESIKIGEVFGKENDENKVSFFDAIGKGKRVRAFTFVRKDGRYYPTEIQFFDQPESSSVDIEEISVSDVKNHWKSIGRTKTEWVEHAKSEFLVPSRIVIEGNEKGRQFSAHLDMRGWEFDPDKTRHKVSVDSFRAEKFSKFEFQSIHALFPDVPSLFGR